MSSINSDLTDNMKCTICSQLLLNAVQTDCGCRYCQICLDEYLARGNRKCLTDGCGDINNTFPDNAVNRDIGRLVVRCLFTECQQEGMLKDIGLHEVNDNLSRKKEMSSINSNLPNIIKRYRKKHFPLNLTDNLKCIICSQLLLNAMQTDCGCRYCQVCLKEYLVRGKKCLTEGCGDINSTIPDNAVNREIGRLIVKCLFTECKEEGMLKDIGDHLDNCNYQTVNCSKCDEELTKNVLKEHSEKKCVMRKVNCQHCGELMTHKNLIGSHLNEIMENNCPKLEGICPYKCDNIKIVNLLNHRKAFSKKPITCPFSEIGCNQVVTKDNLINHNNEESFKHSELLIKQVATIKNDILELKKKFREMEDLKNEFFNFKLEILDKMKTLEKLPRQITPSTSSVRSTEERTAYRNGTFIWKIERFSELKLEAERGNRISLTSDPFYTKEFGYKMSMKIYPAGNGVGKGTHLSVFFTLMKGEFDDLLPWPFKNKVTLTILDQNNKTNDHSYKFKRDVRSTCYQKPIDEYNIASGSPKFLTFSLLDDDVIFLKIGVINNG